ALKDIGRLRAARAAIGVHRHGVGIDPVGVTLQRPSLVTPAQHWAKEPGWDAWSSGREIRAHVGKRLDTKTQHGAVPFNRKLNILDMVAAMRGRQVVFAPLLDPFHRTSELF